jgi:photosystem II stability/assembly factor-like uncharacterized protein
VKLPPAEDDERRGRGATATVEAAPPPERKIYLRQRDFLDSRGLEGGPGELVVDRAPPEPAPYLRGARQKRALLDEHPPDPGVEWRSLGPEGIPNGQTYGSGTATSAGRVTAIDVDPGDPQHVLVGTAAGGIWQTLDGGRHWAPRTDDQPTLSIGALAFAPSDPATIYAGTGEGNSEYARLGQGLLVSHDGGSSWTVVAEEVFNGIGFYRLVVDPRDGQRVIVATTGGAAESSDGGTTWSLLHRGLTWDVSLGYAGDEPELLLAAPQGLFAARGGAAPAQVDMQGLPALDRDRERMGVAHVPEDPGQAFVFAATGGRARLWHRAQRDGEYERITLPRIAIPPYLEDALDVGQASYDWHVSVPAGGDAVYLGAIDLVKGDRSGGDWEFSDISSRLDGGDSIHPDQHTMAFDPRDPGVIYAGNDGGVFRSPDGGDTWESLNTGLVVSEVEYLTQRPEEPDWILAGLQDNGTIRRESNHGWTQVALGDGGDCGTNMAEPDVCFHSHYYMSLKRSDRRGDPDSWVRVSPPDSDARLKLFYPPVEVNGDVVVKAGDHVFISTRRGRDWQEIPLPPPQLSPRPSVASALAIPKPERVLVGTIAGDVFRIDRAGAGWGDPELLPRPLDGWISDLVVDPDVKQRYWVTFSSPGAVLRSDDEGATWIDVTANLPAIPVNAVVGDPADPDRLWVACDVGVFETRDAGGSWAVFGTGLPNALAVDLLFYEPERLLRVGTRNRGVWETQIT